MRRLSTPAVVALTVLMALVLGACSSAASPGKNEGPTTVDNGFAPAAIPSGATDGKGGTGSAADLAARKIVKTGDITIEVPNVAAALARVRTLALQLGGYVGGSQAGTLDQSATLTLRIPADKFDEAIARLHELDGTVLSEATREEDVTSALVDLDARLKNLQASETQYRLLLEKSVKIEDILAVQTRLDDVRGQIEQLQAQQKELAGLADLSTLTVSLVPGAVQAATDKWDPGKTVSNAFAALVDAVQGLANGAIWFAIVWLPVLIVLGILVWLLMRLFPGLRRRMPRPAPPAPPTQE
jgi:Domain of unknown function (DUF4349)